VFHKHQHQWKWTCAGHKQDFEAQQINKVMVNKKLTELTNQHVVTAILYCV
jgi:hypothetical protein